MGVTELTELLLAEDPNDPREHNHARRAFLRRVAGCRTEKLGGAILCCPCCGARMVVFNPCHQRGCPKCGQAVQYQWQRGVLGRLLPVGHHHLVLGAPELLTAAWRVKPKAVIECLFAAANRTFKTLSKRTGLQFGILLIFHSHGKGLSYKPHLHCMLSSGGIDSGGQWKPYRSINEKQLRSDFHRWMLEQAAKWLAAEVAAGIQLTRSAQWPVYGVYHGPEQLGTLVGYFARTFHGLTVEASSRLSYDQQKVSYSYHHLGSEYRTTLSLAEFRTRYFAHIAPAGTVTVRHYGLYATRHAEALQQLSGKLAAEAAVEPKAQQEEPLHCCPLCHAAMSLERVFLPHGLPEEVRSAAHPRGSPIVHGQILEPTLVSV